MTTQLDADALLLPQEAADFLQVNKDVLADWREQGGGPQFMRVGERIFYWASNLEKYSKEQQEPR